MIKTETNAGVITATSYDDGMAKGVKLLLDGEIVCMLDVMEHPTEGGTRLIVYSEYNDDEPTHFININKDKENKTMMTNAEFQNKLNSLMEQNPMINRSKRKTLNEVLWVLRQDKEQDYCLNFEVHNKNGDREFGFAPSLHETFINVKTLAKHVVSIECEDYEDAEYPVLVFVLK